MIKCESEISTPASNGLTKIEEHDEFESNDQCNEDAKPNSVSQDKIDGDDTMQKNNELSKMCEMNNDFDPLNYAIEFFGNYNSDANQFCAKPVISSQG